MDAMAQALRHALKDSLESLERIPLDKLLDLRYERLMGFGQYKR